MRNIWIFDLDDTLADTTHRTPLIADSETWGLLPPEEQQWEKYYEACVNDSPIEPVKILYNSLIEKGDTVYIWTHRSNAVREHTKTWLLAKGFLEPADLRMVSQQYLDEHPQHQIPKDTKIQWYKRLPRQEYVKGVFEDRKSIVDLWRAAGVQCYQVQEADW